MYRPVQRVFNDYYRAIDSALEFITIRRQMHEQLTAIHHGLLDQVASLRPAYQGDTAGQFFATHQQIAVRSRMLLIQMTEGHDEWTPRLQQLRTETEQHEQAIMQSLGNAPSMLWDFLEPHFPLPSLQHIITYGQQSVPEHPVAIWERLMPQPPAQPLEFIEDEVSKFVSGFLGQLGMAWNEATDAVSQFGQHLFHLLDFMHMRSGQLGMIAADMPCGGNTVTIDPFLDGTEQRPRPQNMQDLYNVINYQYQRSVKLHSGAKKAGLTPVGITPIGDNTILVSLVGIEPIPTNSNTWINGVGSGSQKDSATDPYEEDVFNIIQEYINQNGGNFKKPIRVIIAGHSYGGIVAQELAANHAKEKDYYFISDVVTFGSPEVGPYNRKDNVQYTQYFTQHDIVPMASGEEAWPHINSLTQSLAAGGDQNANEDALVETGLLALDINKGNDPIRKQQWTAIDGNPGETPLTDNTMNITDFAQAHGAYATSSQLAHTPLPSDWPPITSATWGKTSYYTVTQTGTLKDIYDPNADDYITPTPIPPVQGPVPTQPTPTPGHQ